MKKKLGAGNKVARPVAHGRLNPAPAESFPRAVIQEKPKQCERREKGK